MERGLESEMAWEMAKELVESKMPSKQAWKEATEVDWEEKLESGVSLDTLPSFLAYIVLESTYTS